MTTKSQETHLLSHLSELSRAAALVNGFCAGLPVSEADLAALHLAVEEIVSNVITHGYGPGRRQEVILRLETLPPDRVRITVRDDAPPYNPLSLPEIDTRLPLEARPVGGLGVHLVRKLMDSCLYERREDQNWFVAERRLRRSTDPATSATIAATRLGTSAVLALTGRLDGLSSPELERQVAALIQNGVRSLEFDLSGLDYVGSAGLRVFLLAAKTLGSSGGEVRFAALRPGVREVFEVTGLLEILDVRMESGAEPPA